MAGSRSSIRVVTTLNHKAISPEPPPYFFEIRSVTKPGAWISATFARQEAPRIPRDSAPISTVLESQAHSASGFLRGCQGSRLAHKRFNPLSHSSALIRMKSVLTHSAKRVQWIHTSETELCARLLWLLDPIQSTRQ